MNRPQSRFNAEAACKQLLLDKHSSSAAHTCAYWYMRRLKLWCRNARPCLSTSASWNKQKTQISSIGRVMGPMELSSNRHRVRLLLISVHLFGCSLLSSVVCSCVRHKACKVPVPAPLLVVAHAQRMLSARSQN